MVLAYFVQQILMVQMLIKTVNHVHNFVKNVLTVAQMAVKIAIVIMDTSFLEHANLVYRKNMEILLLKIVLIVIPHA